MGVNAGEDLEASGETRGHGSFVIETRNLPPKVIVIERVESFKLADDSKQIGKVKNKKGGAQSKNGE